MGCRRISGWWGPPPEAPKRCRPRCVPAAWRCTSAPWNRRRSRTLPRAPRAAPALAWRGRRRRSSGNTRRADATRSTSCRWPPGAAQLEGRTAIGRADVEWVLDCGRYAARPASGALRAPAVGRVHGLAVYGAQQGAVMDVEAVAVRGQGRVLVTGIVEEEEMGPDGHRPAAQEHGPRLGRKRGDAAAPPGLCAGRTGPSYQFSGRRAGGRPVGRRGDGRGGVFGPDRPGDGRRDRADRRGKRDRRNPRGGRRAGQD